MTLQTIASPSVRALYEAELAELRLMENELFQQALSSPRDEMVNKFGEIWMRREHILKELEAMNIPPMPNDLLDNTAKSVSATTCTLEEFLAIPKPGRWKFVRASFLPACWMRYDVPGRFDSLPDSIIKMYKLTSRQIAILEGKIKVEKSQPAPAQLPQIEGAKPGNVAGIAGWHLTVKVHARDSAVKRDINYKSTRKKHVQTNLKTMIPAKISVRLYFNQSGICLGGLALETDLKKFSFDGNYYASEDVQIYESQDIKGKNWSTINKERVEIWYDTMKAK